jgi:hypothetical protein
LEEARAIEDPSEALRKTLRPPTVLELSTSFKSNKLYAFYGGAPQKNCTMPYGLIS